jgi:hypothetical protein
MVLSWLTVTASGTEPGDFVDLDMDSIAVDRQMRLQASLADVLPELEAETEGPLSVEYVDGVLLLRHGGEVRYVASLTAAGRLVVTDRALGDRL